MGLRPDVRHRVAVPVFALANAGVPLDEPAMFPTTSVYQWPLSLAASSLLGVTNQPRGALSGVAVARGASGRSAAAVGAGSSGVHVTLSRGV